MSQVIQRIFYVVNRSWTGRITMMELRRSNFLQTLALLEEEDDINQITDYFSYEHFYVIYCKFWELDTDHDLYIDPKDLARYNDHGKNNSKSRGFIFPHVQYKVSGKNSGLEAKQILFQNQKHNIYGI